jgi:hypothetical protein
MINEKGGITIEASQQNVQINMPFGEKPFSLGLGDVTNQFGSDFSNLFRKSTS